MPFSIAFLATNSPTFLAASLLLPVASPNSLSKVEAEIRVFPATSSMICAYIFFSLLYTESLGLKEVPETFLRTLR